MQIPATTSLACVEIGGGGIQTVLFTNGADPVVLEGAHQPDGSSLAFAVPGLIVEGLVVEASNLGWREVDPVQALGLRGPAAIVVNDAEAAALGEYALREPDAPQRLVYVCIGTGIGGAVIENGDVLRSNLFGHNADGHGTRFGDQPCRCGRVGCLETVAAGWALPEPLLDDHVRDIATHLATAIEDLSLASTGTIVVGGGIARRYPRLVDELSARLPSRVVEGSHAPDDVKSASAWGLRAALAARTA